MKLLRVFQDLYKGNSSERSSDKERILELKRMVQQSGKFDAMWYLNRYPDVRSADMDALQHFCAHGDREFRSPGPDFDSAAYAQTFPERGGLGPLEHYLAHLAPEEQETPTFMISEAQPAETPAPRRTAEKSPPPPEPAANDPLSLVRGSGLFDAAWYRAKYPDIRNVPDPLEHFAHFGIHESRDPGPKFSSALYRITYASQLKAGDVPFIHYLHTGKKLGLEPVEANSYAAWRRMFDQLTDDDTSLIAAHAAALQLAPSAIYHVFDKDAAAQAADIFASWQAQLLPSWQAVVLFAPDVPAEMRATVAGLAQDDRITVATEAASIAFAPDQQTLFVHGAALLAPHATYLTQEAFARHTACISYGDHDILASGQRVDPVFKPIFSPTLLRSDYYIGPVLAFKPDTLTPSEFSYLLSALARWDVDPLATMLRHAPRDQVAHVPFALASRHQGSALPAFTPQPAPEPKNWPSVSLLILTRDKIDLMSDCVESVLAKSTYPRDRLEIVAVDNGSVTPEAIAWFAQAKQRENFKVIHAPVDFNFAYLNNLAAKQASGEVLILLNNDTLIIAPDWIERIVEHCMEPDVAAVGAKLLYPDDTIQHGGCNVGVAGLAAHRCKDKTHEDVRAFDFTRELTAVTGACLGVRRDVYEKLGGLDETLRIAFNDVKFCVDAAKAGYRNIYVAQPLIYHLESKSRGYDITRAQQQGNLREAIYARTHGRSYFQNDPFYSPNLSQTQIDDLAFPPRRALPWRDNNLPRQRRVLLLSATHTIGSGVAVVLNEQAQDLRRAGYDVHIAGPDSPRDWQYAGCTRTVLSDALGAANLAVMQQVDAIIVHTPPFYGVVRHVGAAPLVYFHDHGEPNPEFFPDWAAREDVNWEKRFNLPLADRVFAISNTIRDQSLHGQVTVARNGNSHLTAWDSGMPARRKSVREVNGWQDRFVVLNVCRFGEGERHYKGIDKYIEVMKELWFLHPETNGKIEFVLVGKGAPADVVKMTREGLFVRANVSDAEIIDLQAAADLYMNFSKWEGYNLGVGQALAMGLPVIASDIEAHREFPITATNSTRAAIEALCKSYGKWQSKKALPRKAFIEDWAEPLAQLRAALEQDFS
jgi:GT2 family glycosyltransferase